MNRIVRGIAVFLGLVAVGIVSAFAVIALLLRQEEVRVPDLTGQDVVSVLDVLYQQGLQIKVDRRESSQSLPRDAIISQMPPPGSSVKKGRQIRVVVSLGPSETQTPKLTGEHFRKADIMIRQAGYLPGVLSRASSETVDRDLVIAQEPPAGSQLDRGGKISLLISSGKRQETMVMPRLVGRKAEEAITLVDRMNLQHRVQYRSAGASGGTDRTVLSQKPGPGSPVAPDGTVELVVSK